MARLAFGKLEGALSKIACPRQWIRESRKAAAGFEPATNGFAIRPLEPLGYAADNAVNYYGVSLFLTIQHCRVKERLFWAWDGLSIAAKMPAVTIRPALTCFCHRFSLGNTVLIGSVPFLLPLQSILAAASARDPNHTTLS